MFCVQDSSIRCQVLVLFTSVYCATGATVLCPCSVSEKVLHRLRRLAPGLSYLRLVFVLRSFFRTVSELISEMKAYNLVLSWFPQNNIYILYIYCHYDWKMYIFKCH